MLTVLHLVHGFPPRETAGTERATARLVDALAEQGWTAHVLSATRAPGHPQYSRLDSPGITRVVNNWARPDLSRGGRDRVMEARVAEVIQERAPDIIHVHHTAFWSTRLRFDRPALGTLHDYWGWCAAGGRLQRPDQSPCAGPDPAQCGACFDHAVPEAPWAERTLGAVARTLHPVIEANTLHRAWRSLSPNARRWVSSAPERLKRTLEDRSALDETPLTPWAHIELRNDELRETWSQLDIRTAPSAFLAHAAEERGFGSVKVLENAVDWHANARQSDGPFLFVGTLQPHKGAHLVISAYKRAFGDDGPGLRILGDPAGDVAYAEQLDWPLEGRADSEEVRRAMSNARAVVLGSTWAENAPLVVLEARAVGCPVLAPEIGGLPELVTSDRDGWLYPPGDVAALSALMQRKKALASLPVAPPLRAEEQAAQFASLYRGLLSSRAPSRSAR